MSNLAPWSVLHVAVSHFDLASSCEKTVEIVFRFLCCYFIIVVLCQPMTDFACQSGTKCLLLPPPDHHCAACGKLGKAEGLGGAAMRVRGCIDPHWTCMESV